MKNKKTKIFFCACLVVAVGFFDVFASIVLIFFLIGVKKGGAGGCGYYFRSQDNTTGQSHRYDSYEHSTSSNNWGSDIWASSDKWYSDPSYRSAGENIYRR